MKKQKKNRAIKDHRKAVRANPPKVASDIDKLVEKWNGSDDQKRFAKRHARV